MARGDPTLFDAPFDSPIVSPIGHFGSTLLNTIPGYKLAELILNDPEAWEVLDGNNEEQVDGRLPLDESETEELVWLEGEIRQLGIYFTPTVLYSIGSALPEEDFIIPRSPTQSGIVKAISEHQELAIPRSVQQDKLQASPKPNPITVSPAYVHEPPGGLDVPRQGFTERSPNFDADNMIHLLNSEFTSHGSYGAELHTRLSRVLCAASHAIDGTMGAVPESSATAFSPSSSGSSSSSDSSPRQGLRSVERPDPPGSVLLDPSSNAASVGSPSRMHSASATLSFIQWHGIHANTLSGSAAANQVSSAETGPSSSKTPHIDYLLQTSSAATVDSDAPRNELRKLSHGVPELINRTNTKVPFGGEDKTVLPLRVVTSDSSIALNPPGGLPSPRKRSLPEYLRRCGLIGETPSKRRPSAPFPRSRDCPKPSPTLPLPDTPCNHPPPPPVPPKDCVTPFRGEKAGIRRLPTIPTTSVAPNCNFNVNEASPPIIYTPPSHTSTHASCRPITSSTPFSATRPLARPPRHIGSPASSPAIISTICPSTLRSPPCPTGPRRRGCSNNSTPIRSAQHATLCQ